MADNRIDISLRGRTHTVTCAPGQEPHVRALTAELDRRMAEVARSAPRAGETQLYVLTLLMLADELRTLRKSAAAAPPASAEDAAELAGLKARQDQSDRTLLDALNFLSRRVEQIGERLKGDGA